MTSSPITFVYQTATRNGHATPYKADVYLPPINPENGSPILVYFHGGGLTAGSRRPDTMFPKWLLDDSLKAGFVFASVDYSLLRPATARDMVRDIRKCFDWISTSLQEELRSAGHDEVKLRKAEFVVAGASAGGYMALLAGIHARPKPKAIVFMYGIGGDLLTDRYIVPKTYDAGLEDPTPFSVLDKNDPAAPIIVEAELSEEEPRMMYWDWLMQEAQFLNALTGVSDLTEKLSKASYAERGGAVPKDVRDLFPQLMVDGSFPPSYLVHGTADTDILVEETQNLVSLLEKYGVKHEYAEPEGLRHGFDWGSGPRQPCLAEIVPFLLKQASA